MSATRSESEQRLSQPKDSAVARSDVALRETNRPLPEILERPRARIANYFTARRRRIWREYLTAYALIAPAMLLIFVFGLFPVVFALYASLHKWLIVRGEFRVLTNYFGIVNNFAYIALFALGVGSFVGAGILIRRVYRRSWLRHGFGSSVAKS